MPAIPAARFWLYKIELVGFKSFADLTSLEFSEKVTVITGKCGSGKSNLISAIKWALGETMSGILFRGSAARPAAKFAIVRLKFKSTVENPPGVADEVLVERRLSCEGRATNFIGGKPVTLEQFGLVLLKIGIDYPANLFIEQKSINPFLASKGKITHRAFAREMGLSSLRKQIIAAKRECLRAKLNLMRIESIQRELSDEIKAEMKNFRNGTVDLNHDNRQVMAENKTHRQMHDDHSVQIRDIEMLIQKACEDFRELEIRYDREFQSQIERVMQILVKVAPIFLPGSAIQLELSQANSALDGLLAIYLLIGGQLRLLPSLAVTEMQLAAMAVILSIRLLHMPPFLCIDGIAASVGTQLNGQLGALSRQLGAAGQIIVTGDRAQLGISVSKVFEVRVDEEGVSSVQMDKDNSEGTISYQDGE